MNGRAPLLLASVTAVGAVVAGLASAGSLYVGLRNAEANRENARAAAAHDQTLAALTAQLDRLERACDARKPSRDGIRPHAVAEARAPGALPAEQIEALAASVADRLTEPETAAPEPRNPDHIAAFDAANRAIGQALDRRRWTDADAAAMQDIVRRLHAEDAAELRRRLAVAVNDQELELASRDTF